MNMLNGKVQCGAIIAALCVLVAAPPTAHAKPELTDQKISDKIEDELFVDPGVIATKVNVSTSAGVATLSGSVTNILAKERAARIAQTVKGVRSVVNRIKVKPSHRTDVQITRDVELALLDDPATDSYEIETTVSDGVVTLSGTVESFQERELAKTVAKGVIGVTAINDNIDVNYKSNRPDLEIKREIEKALQWNAHVDNYLVNVNVKDGKVDLTGTVGSAAEKRVTESEAWVAGVSSVDATDLSVKKWARDKELRGNKFVVKSADELRDAVKDALVYDPRVMSFNVGVDVAGSTVTLRGTVENLKAKRAAEQDAKNTVGVSYVNNRLKVRLDSPIEDSAVAEDVRNALVRDPYVDRFEITTTVLDGTAHLYGTVDSYFEKNRADDVASRVIGVLDVENHLVVDHDDAAYIYDPYVDLDYVDHGDLINYERRAPLLTDNAIKDAIESEIWWSPFVDSEQVDVSVDDGVATLTARSTRGANAAPQRKTPMKAVRRWSTTILSSVTTNTNFRIDAPARLPSRADFFAQSRRRIGPGATIRRGSQLGRQLDHCAILS